MTKQLKKLQKDVFGMVGTGIGMGVGASAISSVGGDTKAIGNISKKMPVMGSMIGAGAVMNSLGHLKTNKKKKSMF